MLRRRRDAEAQAAGEAEGGEEKDARIRQRLDSSEAFIAALRMGDEG
jgi:hypothetical protein